MKARQRIFPHIRWKRSESGLSQIELRVCVWKDRLVLHLDGQGHETSRFGEKNKSGVGHARTGTAVRQQSEQVRRRRETQIWSSGDRSSLEMDFCYGWV
jgi:hypothetical protein